MCNFFFKATCIKSPRGLKTCMLRLGSSNCTSTMLKMNRGVDEDSQKTHTPHQTPAAAWQDPSHGCHGLSSGPVWGRELRSSLPLLHMTAWHFRSFSQDHRSWPETGCEHCNVPRPHVWIGPHPYRELGWWTVLDKMLFSQPQPLLISYGYNNMGLPYTLVVSHTYRPF